MRELRRDPEEQIRERLPRRVRYVLDAEQPMGRNCGWRCYVENALTGERINDLVTGILADLPVDGAALCRLQTLLGTVYLHEIKVTIEGTPDTYPEDPHP